MSEQLAFDLVRSEQLEEAIKFEIEGFPQDEAATLDVFRLRQSQAHELFLGAFVGPERKLVGYICATLSPSAKMTHESMQTHIPSGTSVCIHSVCLSPAYQNKGVGSKLLKEYVRRLNESDAGYERVMLICHEEFRSFYEKNGFGCDGPSAVAHGSRPWLEMGLTLSPKRDKPTTTSSPESSDPQFPPGLFEALQRPTNRVPRPSRLLSEYPGGILDVIIELNPEEQPGVSANMYDLVCPRERCGSVILKKHAGQWVERASVQLDLPSLPVSHLLERHPDPPGTANWWLITPSPMAFENIGFSRPVEAALSENGKKMKFLACAECDLGALGWSEEGGSEFWLACSRVRYRE